MSWLTKLKTPAGLVAVAVLFGSVFPASAARPEGASAFTPITPCRILDTRPGGERVGDHDRLGSDATIVVAGRNRSGECELPGSATGLSLNVTAVTPTDPTFLSLWPSNAERPVASSLNPSPSDLAVPNAVTVALSPAGEFSVFNRAGSVDVVIDVVGYYGDHNHSDTTYSKAQVDSMLDDLRSDLVSVETTQWTPTVRSGTGGAFEQVGREGSYTWVGPDSGAGVLTTEFTITYPPGLNEYPTDSTRVVTPAGYSLGSVVASQCVIDTPDGPPDYPVDEIMWPLVQGNFDNNPDFPGYQPGKEIVIEWLYPWTAEMDAGNKTPDDYRTVRARRSGADIPFDWEEYANSPDALNGNHLRIICSGAFHAVKN